MKQVDSSVSIPHQRQNSVDVSRNLAFLVYGGLYQGLCEQFVYTTLFPSWFGNYPAWESVALQVITDVAFIGPLVCLPTAYVFMNLFASSTTATTSPPITTIGAPCDIDNSVPSLLHRAVVAGLEKYRTDVQVSHLLWKYWTLWIPVQSVTFGLVPPHFRVAFIALISFGWIFILSSVATTNTTTTSNKLG